MEIISKIKTKSYLIRFWRVYFYEFIFYSIFIVFLLYNVPFIFPFYIVLTLLFFLQIWSIKKNLEIAQIQFIRCSISNNVVVFNYLRKNKPIEINIPLESINTKLKWTRINKVDRVTLIVHRDNIELVKIIAIGYNADTFDLENIDFQIKKILKLKLTLQP